MPLRRIIIQAVGPTRGGNPVRYIAYGLAIFAALVGIAFATGTLPRDAIASHNEANGTMNAVHLEQAIYR
jgi:hypothetical protein